MLKKIDKGLWVCPKCLGRKNASYTEGNSSRVYILPCSMCSPFKKIDDKLFFSYRDEIYSGKVKPIKNNNKKQSHKISK